MRYRFFIGYLNFIDGVKRAIEVTDFCEFEKDIKINETIDGAIKKIGEIRFTFPRDIPENANELIGHDDIKLLMNNVNMEDRLPFFITDDTGVIFNGLISEFSRNIMRGWGFNNKYLDITYKLDHKSTELNEKYISERLNLVGVDMKTHIRTLISGNNKITKYRRREVAPSIGYANKPWEDNIWKENVWKDNQYYEPLYRFNSLIIDKNDTQNYKTIKIGDAFHRTYVDSGTVQEDKFSSIIVKITDGIITDDKTSSLDYYKVYGYQGNRFTDGGFYSIKITRIDDFLYNAEMTNAYGDILAQGLNLTVGQTVTINPIVGSSRWADINVNKSINTTITVNPFFIELELRDYFEQKWNKIDSFTEDMIGYEIVTSEEALPIIYNPFISMKKTLTYIADTTEKYYYSFKVDDECNIKIYGNAVEDSNAENTMYIDFGSTLIDNEAVFSEFKEKGDTKNIISGAYAMGYEVERRSVASISINSDNVAKNMFHHLGETIVKPFQQVQSSNTITRYIKMGVGGVVNIGFNMDIDGVDAKFLQSINIPVSRNALDGTKYIYVEGKVEGKDVYQELVKGTSIQDSLDLSPSFLHMADGGQNEIQMYLTDKQASMRVASTDIEANTVTLTGTTTGTDIVFASTDNSYRGIILSSSEDETVVQLVRGDINSVTAETLMDIYIIGLVGLTFIEMSLATSIAKAEWTELDGNRNYAVSLNKTIGLINSYVHQMPVQQSLETYDGKSEILYLLPSTFETDRYSIADRLENTNVGMEFTNEYPEFLNNYTKNYDIVYIQVLNEQTNIWETYRGEEVSNGQLVLKDPQLFNEATYGALIKFRRIFKTKITDFTAKPTNDNIFEAYITNSRNAFGFNYDIDLEAIEYITNGKEDKWKGKIYQFGSIIGADFKTSIRYNRYANDVTSFEKYGFIEDKLDGTITSNEDFIFHSRNELEKRNRSAKNLSLRVRPSIYKQFYSIPLQQVDYVHITKEDGTTELYQVIKKDYLLRKIDTEDNGFVDLSVERI